MKNGKRPGQPPQPGQERVHLNLSHELLTRLRGIAKAERRTLSGEIEVRLKESVNTKAAG